VSKERLRLGKCGEEAAVEFLREQGYKIIARNYRSRFGEIDIIARDKDTLCFVEVKTRHSDRFGTPEEAVTRAKQKQIAKSALSFLKERHLLDTKARFDVVAIVYSKDKPKTELIKDAFELDARFC
jgi:putative endonuclease